MSNPLVSVIIPTYNSARYVGEAIESVLAQDYRPLEVIVVDDGSTDGTREQLAAFGDRIKYIYQENAGPSKARNRGLREARGDFIAFLDADDLWLPEKLTRQHEFLKQHPKVGLVHTNIFRHYEETGEREEANNVRRPEFVGDCYPLIFWGHSVSPSSALIRRECFDAVGVFDESIRGPSYEDQDLWMRIARRFHYGYIPEALTIYRIHGANGSQNLKRNVEDEYIVLVKSLKSDPQLWQRLDREHAVSKLYGLACSAAYSCLQADEKHRARWFLCRAICHRPISIWPWAYLPYSFLPRAARNWARSWRDGLFERSKAQAST